MIRKKTTKKSKDEWNNFGLRVIDYNVDLDWSGRFEGAIVVSNDTDLVEPIRISTREHNISVWLFSPFNSVANDLQRALKDSRFKKTIYTSALTNSQLPDQITGTTIRKPATW